jgi:hypothetical protein
MMRTRKATMRTVGRAASRRSFVRHSYSTHHLALSRLRDVTDRQSDTHQAQMHLGRLGASARQREDDLGDPSCGCGRELVLEDMNL